MKAHPIQIRKRALRSFAPCVAQLLPQYAERSVNRTHLNLALYASILLWANTSTLTFPSEPYLSLYVAPVLVVYNVIFKLARPHLLILFLCGRATNVILLWDTLTSPGLLVPSHKTPRPGPGIVTDVVTSLTINIVIVSTNY